jgi:hypothetical protein
MSKTLTDSDDYRKQRQDAFEECCIEAYGLVAECLRHLGVIGAENHEVTQAEIGPRILHKDRKQAIEHLRHAAALLYDAPHVNVPRRIGPRRFWSIEDEDAS